jgi:spermidine synthase
MREVPGGRVLINGLGLGLVVQAAIMLDMKEVYVVEHNPKIIEMVGNVWMKKAKLKGVDLEIIEGDAFNVVVPGTFDVVWHDIWPTISDHNLPEMDALLNKYRKKAKWQGCWQREGCELMRDAVEFYEKEDEE